MTKPLSHRLCTTGLVAMVCLSLGGCATEKPEPKQEWAGAKDLHFSEDARDPTERELEKGFYRLRPKDEPEGTASLLDPDRRPPALRPDKP